MPYSALFIWLLEKYFFDWIYKPDQTSKLFYTSFESIWSDTFHKFFTDDWQLCASPSIKPYSLNVHYSTNISQE